MSKWKIWAASLICLVALVLNLQLVLAHERVTVGDFEIEYGWLTEPVIVGQQNAIVVNIESTSGSDSPQIEALSTLVVTVSYGGQRKTLTLQPLGEDTPGQFIAPILPTIPGQYSITFSGKLGDFIVDNLEVEPEEVQTTDALQFPNIDQTEQTPNLGMANWLVYLNLLIGVVALGLGVMAFRKTR